MPSIAQVPQEGGVGKKRRWEDSGEVVRVCSPNLPHTSRCESTTHPYDSNHAHVSLLEEKQLQHLEYKERERERRILPIPSRREIYKRQRISPSTAYSPLSPTRERTEGKTESGRVEGVTPPKKIDLSPCHICHRKPTIKAELDNFADCEGCRKRTCWICIRECLGSAVGVGRDVEMGGHDSHGGDGYVKEGREELESGRERGGRREGDMGHKGMVCSRCCVERGSEGEVWCFGCLRNENGG